MPLLFFFFGFFLAAVGTEGKIICSSNLEVSDTTFKNNFEKFEIVFRTPVPWNTFLRN